MPLVDLGPAPTKTKKKLIDLGPVPGALSNLQDEFAGPQPISDPNKPLGFTEDIIPATGIPGIADPQDVTIRPPKLQVKPEPMRLEAAKPKGYVKPAKPPDWEHYSPIEKFTYKLNNNKVNYLLERFGRQFANSWARVGETIISHPLSPVGIRQKEINTFLPQAHKELANTGFKGSVAEAAMLANTRAAEMAAAVKVPKFKVDPSAEGLEKATDVAAGLSAFITQLVLTKKIMPKGTPDPVIWEVQNTATGGIPGEGAAIRLTLGQIGKIPTGSLPGKLAKVGLESGLFAGYTAATGGNAEDIIISGLIPVAFNGWNFAKQRLHITRYEKNLKSQALQSHQKRLRQGMNPATSEAYLKADMSVVDNAIAKAKQSIYRDDAFAPARERWEAQRQKALKMVAKGGQSAKQGLAILDFMEKRPGTPTEPSIKMPTTKSGAIRESIADAAKRIAKQPAKVTIVKTPPPTAIPPKVPAQIPVSPKAVGKIKLPKVTKKLKGPTRQLGVMERGVEELKNIQEAGGLDALPKYRQKIQELRQELADLDKEALDLAEQEKAPKGDYFKLPEPEPVIQKPDKAEQFKGMSIDRLKEFIDTTKDAEIQRLAHRELRSRPPVPAPQKPAEAITKPEAVETAKQVARQQQREIEASKVARGQEVEVFKRGQQQYDVTAGYDLISQENVHLETFGIETVPQLRSALIHKDKAVVEKADIRSPILLGTDKDGSFVIDGHHRVEKAIQEGKPIQGYVLTRAQTKKISAKIGEDLPTPAKAVEAIEQKAANPIEIARSLGVEIKTSTTKKIGSHGKYSSRADTITIPSKLKKGLDKNDIIAHELGHRAHTKISQEDLDVFGKLVKEFREDIKKVVDRNVFSFEEKMGKQGYFEAFAELYGKYIQDKKLPNNQFKFYFDDVAPLPTPAPTAEGKVEKVVEDLPIEVKANDIDLKRAERAYAGISFTPEKRAKQTQKDYIDDIKSLYEEMKSLAKSDSQKEILTEELERYKQGYIKKMNSLLDAKSRTMSSMITGPANFPVTRNQKRMATEDKRRDEFLDWKEKAKSSIRKKLKGQAIEEAGGPLAVLEKKLDAAEKRQETMKAVNAIVRKNISDTEKVKLITTDTNLSETTARKLLETTVEDGKPFAGFELTNNRANIKRMQQRLSSMKKAESLTGTEKIGTFKGGEIFNNFDAERVQIIFDEKPNEAIRTALKARGFRWSPKYNAWQRKNTQNALTATKKVIMENFEGLERIVIKPEAPKKSTKTIEQKTAVKPAQKVEAGGKVEVGDTVTVKKGWGELEPGHPVIVQEINELGDVKLGERISPTETVNYGFTRDTNVIKAPKPKPTAEGKVEKAEAPKETKDVEKETITEPAESPKVDTGKAGKIVPTGKLDPTNPEEAVKITKEHAKYVAEHEARVGVGGIFDTQLDKETGEYVIANVKYTPGQIDTAYRTVQKPVESPMPDADLFAMPGKEAQMKALAQKMAKVKGVVKPKKKGPKPLTKPTALPKAKTKKEDHIKAVYQATAKETTRYAINGVKVEGDTIVATDGRRMFWAKGKWDKKDGLYLDATSLKKGVLGKLSKTDIKFPMWRDIVPDVSDQKPILVEDLETTLRHVRQAASITSEESRGVTVIENKDGSLGFAAAAPEVGHVEVNVYPGGKILGAVNPSFLLDVIKFHAIRGNPAFEFYFSEPTRPILTKSLDGKTNTITMPINVGEPTEAVKKAISEWPAKVKPTIQERVDKAYRENDLEELVRLRNEAKGEFGNKLTMLISEVEYHNLDKLTMGELKQKARFNNVPTNISKEEMIRKIKEVRKITKPKPKGGTAGASVAAATAEGGGYGTIAPNEQSVFAEKTDIHRVRQELPGKTSINVLDELLKIASPAHRVGSREGARVLRKNLGKLSQETVVAHKTLRKMHHAFTFMNRKDIYDFIDRLETGKEQLSPRLTQVARKFRSMLDERRDAVQALGKGHLESFFENYFPHIWKDPKAAEKAVRQIFGRRRFEGSKSFLKKRTIMTVKEGRDAGLELVSENPVDLVLLKVFEMDRYLMAHNVIQDLKARSLVKFVYSRSPSPEGYKKIDDRAFTVYMPPEITKKEAYDSVMVDQLMDIARSLGIDAQRFVSLGKGKGRWWGYAQWKTKEGEPAQKVRTRYAGPESVLAHEIGHILGVNYELYDTLRHKKDGSYREITRGKKKGQQKFVPTEEAVKHRKVIDVEWRALADARTKDKETSKGFAKYVRKAREKEAVMLEGLLHAPEEFKKVAPTLHDLFVKFLNAHSELRPILDIKPSLVLGQSDAHIKIPGFTVLGHYYAPEPVAKILNNYLSPGLRNNENYLVASGYNITRMTANVLNQAQLALSGFHALNVTTDMMASTLGQGLRRLTVKGQRARGLADIVSTPISPVLRLWNGVRLRKAYKRQIDTIEDEKLRNMVKAVVLAGGRDRMDPFYYNRQIKALKKTISDVLKGSPVQKVVGIGKLPINTFGATLEVLAKPLMEWYVPTGKLGLFSMMAQHEMQRAESGQINPEQLHERLISSWDSVDNRMGQLVYDNLFWNKTLKDVSMLGLRSVGWNLGSWREYGGVPVDIIGTRGRLQRGDVLLSQKMAYTIGAVTLYATLGATIMYLLTGKGPEEPKDYFFPKTGRKNPDGSDERLSLPTYAKDWFAYATQPIRTVKNKLHPLWGLLTDLVKNKDFFNTEVRHPGDPVSEQLLDVAEHIGKEFLPLSVRNYNKMQKAKPSGKNLWVSITGITSAPSYIVRSPAQKLMYRYIVENIPDKTKTKEQQELYGYRRTIKNRIRKGDPVDVNEAKRRLGVQSWQRLLADARKDSFAESFGRLSLTQALNVYAIASTKERNQAMPILQGKWGRARKKTPEMHQMYEGLLRTR